MAMAKFIADDLQEQSNRHPSTRRLSKQRKMVYIAPSKALCEERFNDWKRRLSSLHLGIEVAMITGDLDPGACYHDLSAAHLILTTPEKWDSISRKWSENFFIIASVKLFMIDEVHLLGDESRGCCLESIVTRMKSIQRAALAINATPEDLRTSSYPFATQRALNSNMRMIAVSATLPNIVDVAEFLGATEAYAFDASFRPVPLTKHVSPLGNIGKNEFQFWKSLDRHVPELINRFSNGKQTLIFCHTKKETMNVASLLIQQNFGRDERVHSSAPAGTVQHCLDNGVAYHHAGMPPSDRHRVEQAFLAGQLRCLTATSTLAVGVNLPAHLVIVKGTKTWRGGSNGYQDIDKGSLLQMIGRAGRPGLDTSGTAVIMTDNQSKGMIEHLIRGLGLAESRLLKKLADVLNAEISQKVVTTRQHGLRWLKTTFLYARMRKEPRKYAMSEEWRSVDDYLEDILSRVLLQLAGGDQIRLNTDGSISPLPACYIMSHGMVPFDSMAAMSSLPRDATVRDILKALSKMESFQLNVRRHEKKPLNECHKSEHIRFKLDGQLSKIRIKETWQKAYVLLQAYIGQYSFENFTLGQEMTNMANNAQRLLLAAQDYSVRGSQCGFVALQCLKLRRALHFSLWDELSGVLNQIDGVGQHTTSLLKFNGIVSFQHVVDSTEERIEKASGKPKPFGRQLKSLVSQILRHRMSVSADIEYTRGSNIAASATCSVRPVDSTLSSLAERTTENLSYTLVAFTEAPSSCLLFQEGINQSGTYRLKIPPTFARLHIHLIGSLVGVDKAVVIDGNSSSGLSGTKGKGTTNRKVYSKTMNNGERQLPRSKASSFSFSEPLQTKIPFATTKENIPCPSPNIPNAVSPSQGVATVSPHKNGKVGQTSGIAKLPRHQWDQREITDSQRGSVEEHALQTLPTVGMAPSNAAVAYGGQVAAAIVPQHAGRSPLRKNSSFQSGASTEVITPGSHTTSSNNNYAVQYGYASRKRGASFQWKNSKRKQKQNQERAFASRKANLFTSFQHDPNDAESFLETLTENSTNSTSDIIPRSDLQRSQRSFSNKLFRFNKPRDAPSGPRRYAGNPSARMTNQDLLHQKAAEAASYVRQGMASAQNHRTVNTPQQINLSGPANATIPSAFHTARMFPRVTTHLQNSTNFPVQPDFTHRLEGGHIVRHGGPDIDFEYSQQVADGYPAGDFVSNDRDAAFNQIYPMGDEHGHFEVRHRSNRDTLDILPRLPFEHPTQQMAMSGPRQIYRQPVPTSHYPTDFTQYNQYFLQTDEDVEFGRGYGW